MISSTLYEYGSTSNLLPDPQQALPGYGGILPGFQQQQVNKSCRSSIPEDTARSLFNTMFETLVYAKPEDRFKAVLMLVAAYDLPV